MATVSLVRNLIAKIGKQNINVSKLKLKKNKTLFREQSFAGQFIL